MQEPSNGPSRLFEVLFLLLLGGGVATWAWYMCAPDKPRALYNGAFVCENQYKRLVAKEEQEVCWQKSAQS